MIQLLSYLSVQINPLEVATTTTKFRPTIKMTQLPSIQVLWNSSLNHNSLMNVPKTNVSSISFYFAVSPSFLLLHGQCNPQFEAVLIFVVPYDSIQGPQFDPLVLSIGSSDGT